MSYSWIWSLSQTQLTVISQLKCLAIQNHCDPPAVCLINQPRSLIVLTTCGPNPLIWSHEEGWRLCHGFWTSTPPVLVGVFRTLTSWKAEALTAVVNMWRYLYYLSSWRMTFTSGVWRFSLCIFQFFLCFYFCFLLQNKTDKNWEIDHLDTQTSGIVNWWYAGQIRPTTLSNLAKVVRIKMKILCVLRY